MTPEFQHVVFLAPPGGPAAGAAVGGTAAGGGAEAKGRRQKAKGRISSFFIHPSFRVGLERSTVLSRDPANAGRRLTPLPARRHACGMFTGLSGLVAPLFLGGQQRKPVQTSDILAKLEPMEAKLDRLGQPRAPVAEQDKTG